jgi:hypothetical protein
MPPSQLLTLDEITQGESSGGYVYLVEVPF